MSQGWFTVEKIDAATYAISEYGHWEQMHSYLLIGEKQACLIDTGLGIGNIKEVTDQLTDLPVVVLTTHVHWDHIGGHGLYSEIGVHRADVEWLKNGIPVPLEMVRKNVMLEPFTQPAPNGFAIEQYVPFTGEPTLVLEDDEVIDLGGRSLRIFHTPGHSPGHICVYEAERGYLFTGDLVYQGTLYAFYPSTDPVAFVQSVERMAALPGVTKILPAHHELNLSQDFLQSVHQGLQELKRQGLVYHGAGEHDFGLFRVKF